MNTNINRKVTGGLLGFAALLTAGLANAATVSMTPSVNTVAVNSVFNLTVQGTGFVNDVSSGSIFVQWDPASLTLNSTLADIDASAASNGFPLDFGVNTLTPGELSATYATFGTVFGPTFDFFTLEFTAIPPPSVSSVDVLAGAYGDWQDGTNPAQPYTDVTYVGATVNVQPVPVPAAVWLFGSGLLGLVGVARRRMQASAR